MIKLIKLFFGSGVLSCLITACATAQATSSEPKPLTEAQFKSTQLPYSVMAYNSRYAHERGLDVTKAINLPQGLNAVTFAFYKKFHPAWDNYKAYTSYECLAKLYIDKNLDILWPEDKSKVSKIPPLYGDLKVFMATPKLQDYNGRIGPESYTSLFFEGFDKTKSTQFNEITLTGACSKFPPKANLPIEIWLERKGGPDYSSLATSRIPIPKDFYRFRLPVSYTQQFFKYTIAATHFTTI